MGTQRKKSIGSVGVLWVQLGEMQFLNLLVLAIKKL
jgi:hypothetical protein